MIEEAFDALVDRLETQARRNPGNYRRRVILLALLGNVYLAFMLFALLLLFLISLASIFALKAIGIKIALVVGVFLWVVIKALWVRVEPPDGVIVRRKKAPELFAMIDDLRARLDAPVFHQVLITEDFNAGVVQLPRLGIFGWQKNYLLIGLPLMKSLSVEHFKAVLAHEFGHLAKSHGRMSNWIYRQRLRWARLMNVLEANNSRGTFLFKPFLKWYSPYFNAYSFPLARANEYEADRASARLTSPKATAEALTGVSVVASYLEERYWPKIHKEADVAPQPGFAPFSVMGRHVSTDLDEPSIRNWVDKAMAMKTTSADTHPSLADRLQSIGEQPRLILPASGESAERLLGVFLEPVTEHFDQRWKEKILPSWQQRYQHVQAAHHRLKELDDLHDAGGALSPQDAYERAYLNDVVGNDGGIIIEQLRDLLCRDAENAAANFMLGMKLLERNDESGVALVTRAMKLNEDTIYDGAVTLRNYYLRENRESEAQKWLQVLKERVELEQLAFEERNQLFVKDKYMVPEIAEDVMRKLKEQLNAVPGLRKAYFLQKQTKYLQHRRLYVLGFVSAGWFRMHNKKRAAVVLQNIQETVQFPGETFIVDVEGENYKFGRKFRRIQHARIV